MKEIFAYLYHDGTMKYFDTSRIITAVKTLYMCVLFSCCFVYMFFGARFAKLHITIPHIPMPIFIGEVLLAIGFIACLPFLNILRRKKSAFIGLIVLMLFLAVKTIAGYLAWGTLAFRHAALFYYAFFAYIAYSCFDVTFWGKRFSKALIILIGFLSLLLFKHVPYYGFLIAAVIASLKNKKGRVLAIILFFVCFPYDIRIPRSLMLASMSALFYVMSMGWVYIQSRTRVKVFATLAIVIIAVLSFSFLADWRDIYGWKALGDIEKLSERYTQCMKTINEEQEQFTFKEFKKNLFAAPKKKGVTLPHYDLERWRDDTSYVISQYDNILWRLFVWRDMAQEIWKKKAWGGIAFGFPFRSKTIEILRWSNGAEVGWLEPHNSFLHIFYRGGLFGLLFIGVIFYVVGRIVLLWIVEKNATGMFITAMLVYMMVNACFMVLLEIPYYAIPFWCLLGCLVRYCDVTSCQDFAHP